MLREKKRASRKNHTHHGYLYIVFAPAILEAVIIQEVESLALSFLEMGGRTFHGLEHHVAPATRRRRFVANFGVSPCLCAWVWIIGYTHFNLQRVEPLYLLMTLNLLKTDDTEACMKGRWGLDEKTIRKWVYITLDVIADLDLVSIDVL